MDDGAIDRAIEAIRSAPEATGQATTLLNRDGRTSPPVGEQVRRKSVPIRRPSPRVYTNSNFPMGDMIVPILHDPAPFSAETPTNIPDLENLRDRPGPQYIFT